MRTFFPDVLSDHQNRSIFFSLNRPRRLHTASPSPGNLAFGDLPHQAALLLKEATQRYERWCQLYQTGTQTELATLQTESRFRYADAPEQNRSRHDLAEYPSLGSADFDGSR